MEVEARRVPAGHIEAGGAAGDALADVRLERRRIAARRVPVDAVAPRQREAGLVLIRAAQAPAAEDGVHRRRSSPCPSSRRGRTEAAGWCRSRSGSAGRSARRGPRGCRPPDSGSSACRACDERVYCTVSELPPRKRLSTCIVAASYRSDPSYCSIEIVPKCGIRPQQLVARNGGAVDAAARQQARRTDSGRSARAASSLATSRVRDVDRYSIGNVVDRPHHRQVAAARSEVGERDHPAVAATRAARPSPSACSSGVSRSGW